jgi:hypothetical protein
MSKRDTLQKSGDTAAPAVGRRALPSGVSICTLPGKSANSVQESSVLERLKMSVNDLPRRRKTARQRLIVVASLAEQRRCVARSCAWNAAPDRSGTTIPVRGEWLRSQGQVPLTSRAERRRLLLAETYDGRHIRVRMKKSGSELPGARAYEGASLTFLQRGIKMFRDAANGSLVGRYRLFHQKTSEHGSGCFIEPLFKESINFLL